MVKWYLDLNFGKKNLIGLHGEINILCRNKLSGIIHLVRTRIKKWKNVLFKNVNLDKIFIYSFIYFLRYFLLTFMSFHV